MAVSLNSSGKTKDANALIDKIDGSQDSSKKHYKRSPFARRKAPNFKIYSQKEDEATMYIYDEISWWGISAEDFVKSLNEITAGTIHLRINSPGGSVFDGTAIFNAIRSHDSKIITHIDGLAASISSIIALAGNEVHMSDNAWLMIHEPWSMVIGDADQMRQEAELLDKISGNLARMYADMSGKDIETIQEMMKAETWFTAKEAKDIGLINTIENAKDDEAKAMLFDLSVFANVPDELIGPLPRPNERDAEKSLREVGFSANCAKKILAKGFCEGLREEDSQVANQREVEPPEEENHEEKEPLNNAQKLILRGKVLLNKK